MTVSVPASLGHRFMSILIDESICMAMAILVLSLMSISSFSENEAGELAFNPMPIYLASFAVRISYFVPQWSIFGKSLPNHVMKIRVANLHTENRLSILRAIARVVVTHALVTPYLIGIPVIVISTMISSGQWLRWLNEGQGIHDKLAGSVVLGKQIVSHRTDLEGSLWDLVD